MSDYPMLISNKLHSFRNFKMQIYIFLITEIIDNKNSRNHFKKAISAAPKTK